MSWRVPAISKEALHLVRASTARLVSRWGSHHYADMPMAPTNMARLVHPCCVEGKIVRTVQAMINGVAPPCAAPSTMPLPSLSYNSSPKGLVVSDKGNVFSLHSI